MFISIKSPLQLRDSSGLAPDSLLINRMNLLRCKDNAILPKKQIYLCLYAASFPPLHTERRSAGTCRAVVLPLPRLQKTAGRGAECHVQELLTGVARLCVSCRMFVRHLSKVPEARLRHPQSAVPIGRELASCPVCAPQ